MSFISPDSRVIDSLERIRDKVDITTGFKGNHANARKLIEIFKAFDLNGVGEVNQSKFTAAMTHLNFVGVAREVEALFQYYDQDGTGSIDYIEFSNDVFDLGSKPKLDHETTKILENVRLSIIHSHGAIGFNMLKRMFLSIDTDQSHTIDVLELRTCLEEMQVQIVSSGDIYQLFGVFDKMRSGKIFYDTFLIALKGAMPAARKHVLHKVFNHLDTSRNGFLFVFDILKQCNFAYHPSHIAGALTLSEVREDMLMSFKNGNVVDGHISWIVFVDYYQSISLAIENDEHFYVTLKETWSF